MANLTQKLSPVDCVEGIFKVSHKKDLTFCGLVALSPLAHHLQAYLSTQWGSHPNLPWPQVRVDLILVDVAEALAYKTSEDLPYGNGANTTIWFLHSHQCSPS